MFLFLDAFTFLKDEIGGLLRLAPDALHVHVGLAIFFGVALLVRGPRAFVTAFWVVLAVAVAAEVLDLLYDLEVGRRLRWMNSVKDILNAVIWPAAWMVFGSYIARLVRPDASDQAPKPERRAPAERTSSGAEPAGKAGAKPAPSSGMPGRESALKHPAGPGIGGVEGVGK